MAHIMYATGETSEAWYSRYSDDRRHSHRYTTRRHDREEPHTGSAYERGWVDGDAVHPDSDGLHRTASCTSYVPVDPSRRQRTTERDSPSQRFSRHASGNERCSSSFQRVPSSLSHHQGAEEGVPSSGRSGAHFQQIYRRSFSDVRSSATRMERTASGTSRTRRNSSVGVGSSGRNAFGVAAEVRVEGKAEARRHSFSTSGSRRREVSAVWRPPREAGAGRTHTREERGRGDAGLSCHLRPWTAGERNTREIKASDEGQRMTGVTSAKPPPPQDGKEEKGIRNNGKDKEQDGDPQPVSSPCTASKSHSHHHHHKKNGRSGSSCNFDPVSGTYVPAPSAPPEPQCREDCNLSSSLSSASRRVAEGAARHEHPHHSPSAKEKKASTPSTTTTPSSTRRPLPPSLQAVVEGQQRALRPGELAAIRAASPNTRCNALRMIFEGRSPEETVKFIMRRHDKCSGGAVKAPEKPIASTEYQRSGEEETSDRHRLAREPLAQHPSRTNHHRRSSGGSPSKGIPLECGDALLLRRTLSSTAERNERREVATRGRRRRTSFSDSFKSEGKGKEAVAEEPRWSGLSDIPKYNAADSEDDFTAGDVPPHAFCPARESEASEMMSGVSSVNPRQPSPPHSHPRRLSASLLSLQRSCSDSERARQERRAKRERQAKAEAAAQQCTAVTRPKEKKGIDVTEGQRRRGSSPPNLFQPRGAAPTPPPATTTATSISAVDSQATQARLAARERELRQRDFYAAVAAKQQRRRATRSSASPRRTSSSDSSSQSSDLAATMKPQHDVEAPRGFAPAQRSSSSPLTPDERRSNHNGSSRRGNEDVKFLQGYRNTEKEDCGNERTERKGGVHPLEGGVREALSHRAESFLRDVTVSPPTTVGSVEREEEEEQRVAADAVQDDASLWQKGRKTEGWPEKPSHGDTLTDLPTMAVIRQQHQRELPPTALTIESAPIGKAPPLQGSDTFESAAEKWKMRYAAYVSRYHQYAATTSINETMKPDSNAKTAARMPKEDRSAPVHPKPLDPLEPEHARYPQRTEGRSGTSPTVKVAFQLPVSSRAEDPTTAPPPPSRRDEGHHHVKGNAVAPQSLSGPPSHLCVRPTQLVNWQDEEGTDPQSHEGMGSPSPSPLSPAGRAGWPQPAHTTEKEKELKGTLLPAESDRRRKLKLLAETLAALKKKKEAIQEAVQRHQEQAQPFQMNPRELEPAAAAVLPAPESGGLTPLVGAAAPNLWDREASPSVQPPPFAKRVVREIVVETAAAHFTESTTLSVTSGGILAAKEREGDEEGRRAWRGTASGDFGGRAAPRRAPPSSTRPELRAGGDAGPTPHPSARAPSTSSMAAFSPAPAGPLAEVSRAASPPQRRPRAAVPLPLHTLSSLHGQGGGTTSGAERYREGGMVFERTPTAPPGGESGEAPPSASSSPSTHLTATPPTHQPSRTPQETLRQRVAERHASSSDRRSADAVMDEVMERFARMDTAPPTDPLAAAGETTSYGYTGLCWEEEGTPRPTVAHGQRREKQPTTKERDEWASTSRVAAPPVYQNIFESTPKYVTTRRGGAQRRRRVLSADALQRRGDGAEQPWNAFLRTNSGSGRTPRAVPQWEGTASSSSRSGTPLLHRPKKGRAAGQSNGFYRTSSAPVPRRPQWRT